MVVKKNLTVLAGIVACYAASGHCDAKEIPVGVDGCAVLARAVHSEVSAAALFGPGKSGPWVIDTGRGDIVMCTTTARTVSRAFTSAMSTAGYAVSWDGVITDPRAYCIRSFLSNCFPNRNERLPGAGDADAAFVHETWRVVSASVMRQMYNPYSSDEVRFRVSELKLQLGLSLRSVNNDAAH